MERGKAGGAFPMKGSISSLSRTVWEGAPYSCSGGLGGGSYPLINGWGDRYSGGGGGGGEGGGAGPYSGEDGGGGGGGD